MAIKVSGTTVIDDSRNIQNIGIATATIFVGNLTGNINSSGVSTVSSLRATNINASGVTTSTGGFVGALTGTATSTTNIPNLTGAITSNNTTTSLGSFTSAQLSTALTDETGSGSVVFATSPTLVTPVLGFASATSIVVGSAVTAVTINSSGLTISGISTFNGNLIFNQFANEKVNIVAGTANGNTNIDLITNGSVNYFTSNSTATWTPNFRASSTVSLDSVMSTGQVVTATIISTQNNTSYYASAVNVDGTSRTIYWSGGSAPTAGSSSGVDMYTYSIIKTASNTFTVFGSISQYA